MNNNQLAVITSGDEFFTSPKAEQFSSFENTIIPLNSEKGNEYMLIPSNEAIFSTPIRVLENAESLEVTVLDLYAEENEEKKLNLADIISADTELSPSDKIGSILGSKTYRFDENDREILKSFSSSDFEADDILEFIIEFMENHKYYPSFNRETREYKTKELTEKKFLLLLKILCREFKFSVVRESFLALSDEEFEELMLADSKKKLIHVFRKINAFD